MPSNQTATNATVTGASLVEARTAPATFCRTTRFMQFTESMIGSKDHSIQLSKRKASIRAVCGYLDLRKVDVAKFQGWADLQVLDLDEVPCFYVIHCDPEFFGVASISELVKLCSENALEFRVYPSWLADSKISIVIYRLEVADKLRSKK